MKVEEILWDLGGVAFLGGVIFNSLWLYSVAIDPDQIYSISQIRLVELIQIDFWVALVAGLAYLLGNRLQRRTSEAKLRYDLRIGGDLKNWLPE